MSIVDYGRSNPAINTTYFLNTYTLGHWSSTADAGDTSNAWGLGFGIGNVGSFNKSNSYYVRCVRNGL